MNTECFAYRSKVQFADIIEIQFNYYEYFCKASTWGRSEGGIKADAILFVWNDLAENGQVLGKNVWGLLENSCKGDTVRANL